MEKTENKGRCWRFDYLVNRGSVTLNKSSSMRGPLAVFAPRCEKWGILGVQLRVNVLNPQ